jgi:membrane protein DedA with SNARE-associated domain
MSVPHFIAAAFAGGMVRAGIFAYFGDALTRASWSALMQPLLLFAGVLAIPLLFPSGRTWLSEVLRDPSQTDSSSAAPD